jgi:hypothetical protein
LRRDRESVEGGDLLARVLVRNAHHCQVLHAGMGEQHILDLSGKVCSPPPDDHLLQPAFDAAAAPGAHAGQVAAVQPAVSVD